MNFTANQRQAIQAKDSNLQLIACAGSGKTQVIAQRIVELLKAGCRPANIVAFTFTEKAAAELKDRIIACCQTQLGSMQGMAEMFVGTIHAFCLELLKTHIPRYLKFEVLNEVQQSLFIDRHSRESGLTQCTDLSGRPLKRYQDTPYYLEALTILREADTDEQVLQSCSIVNGLEVYRKLLERSCYFDYSAIMEAAVEELTNNEALRNQLAERIRHVVVDEYQDVNPIQEAIIWLLHDIGATLCVVGDDDQTIYQWRGSDVQQILSFASRYPSVKKIHLDENFRSSRGIVETARAFIEQNSTRLPKQMVPSGHQTYEPGDIVALSFEDPDREAAYIAETIRELYGVAIPDPTTDNRTGERGLSWSDMAILLRSVKASATPITRALDQAGIPYIVVGMKELFATREAEAARQLFYFMADDADISPEALRQTWLDAGLGLRRENVQNAVEHMQTIKSQLDNPTERFSFYSIQRVFQTFLTLAELREEAVPHGRGEIVFYNLGKFSQLISDFETIYYHSKPKEKYQSFANFLRHQAEGAYPEGWQDNQYANPDAVKIMTVHQAKGMQWPVVFLPSLLKNRFPSKRQGGRSVWHLLPKKSVKEQQRFEGTREDERRLFYVAMTRSQKFLHLTWASVSGNRMYQKKSEFVDDLFVSKYVKRRRADYTSRKRATPTPRKGLTNVALSFSDLKYFFECPYQFKLRILYGFNAPIHEALGYGRSLHNALAEVHVEAMRGQRATEAQVPHLVDTHLHIPYAYPALKEKLEAAARRVLHDYIRDNEHLFDKIEFAEKQVEINLGDGVTVQGRIDLVRRLDTNETTIVDLKSSERAQAENVTETQLHIYALGYEELTGNRADYVEIYELDERKRKPRAVDDDFIDEVKTKVREAATALQHGSLPPMPTPSKCKTCDYRGLCSAGEGAEA
ncbi:MAG: ATP-dependent helicase [Nitrospirae bacterium]|nr:MAG: ATP-dependent helicase [Nitrospirota bacterium]